MVLITSITAHMPYSIAVSFYCPSSHIASLIFNNSNPHITNTAINMHHYALTYR